MRWQKSDQLRFPVSVDLQLRMCESLRLCHPSIQHAMDALEPVEIDRQSHREPQTALGDQLDQRDQIQAEIIPKLVFQVGSHHPLKSLRLEHHQGQQQSVE